MKILVTGGYGFIGLALVESLLKENHEIIIIDDLSTSNASNNIGSVIHFKIPADSKNCETIFKDYNFDIVIHLAYKKLPNINSEEYNNILQSNNKGLINILYLSEKYNVKKFITMSHYNIYGKQYVFPITEEHELNPKDEQGYDGVVRELYCDQYRRRGLNVTILRFGEVYGPRMNNPNSFIRKMLTLTNSDEELKIDSSILDYIYIGDLVEAIKIVSQKPTPNVLNISTNWGTTQNEIFELFSNLSNRYENIAIKKKNSLNQKYILDNRKAKMNLDWSPKYDLRQGIEKTIQWYENNENISNDLFEERSTDKKSKTKKPYKLGRNYKIFENILMFVVFAVLNYVLVYRLNIKVDLFILYIIFINLIYGFKQGSLAVALSIITNIWFKITFEDMTILSLINDSSTLLYSTMYFIIGLSIGNKVDKIKSKKEILIQDLEDLKEDMNFINEAYDKSIEIKNSLQNVIENYDDSFQKTLGIIETLEKADSNNVFKESQEILTKILKVKQVYIYSITEDRENIKLVAPPEAVKFDSSMKINENEFLKTVVMEEKIFINKSLKKSVPIISAPLFRDDKVTAVIFIDKIDFESLDYQFINTLKVLVYLISNRLSGVKVNIKNNSNADINRKE